MIDDEAQTAAAGRPLGSISTLVSLFLLLLVFFIVLFSIAQVHRQRVDQVVTSIDEAFGKLPSRLGLLPVPEPGLSDDDAASPEGFVRSVSALITGFASLSSGAVPAPGGSLLEIDLPPDQMFDGGTSKLTGTAIGIVSRLAVLLQRQPNPQQHYRLTFRAIVPPPAAGAAIADQAQSLAVARAAVFAAALYAAGCPADGLAVGLDHGDSTMLRLDFALVGQPPEAD